MTARAFVLFALLYNSLTTCRLVLAESQVGHQKLRVPSRFRSAKSECVVKIVCSRGKCLQNQLVIIAISTLPRRKLSGNDNQKFSCLQVYRRSAPGALRPSISHEQIPRCL